MQENIVYELKPIAQIHTGFSQKFGIPRQSGLVDTFGVIEFLPEYRDVNAIKGLEGFSHIWLLWDFSEGRREGSKFEAMVRPPRLGGEKQMGVFATRSPFRPNNIGLSSVEVVGIGYDSANEMVKAESCKSGRKLAPPLIYVKGADILDGTYIFDIKPYLPYTDSHADAAVGWTSEVYEDNLNVEVCLSDEEIKQLGDELEILVKIIAQDPRPHKVSPKDKAYKLAYKNWDVTFTVDGKNSKIIRVDMLE